MKRTKRTLLMAAIAVINTVMGFNGCLIREARDSCDVNLLDWNLTGECVIDVQLPDFDGD